MSGAKPKPVKGLTPEEWAQRMAKADAARLSHKPLAKLLTKVRPIWLKPTRTPKRRKVVHP